VIREDRMKNEYVRISMGISSIVGMMRENRLRWFSHVIRREETNTVRVLIKMNVEGKRRTGRPKKRWLDTIGNYMRFIGVCIEDV
jgi:hypothetical protein